MRPAPTVASIAVERSPLFFIGFLSYTGFISARGSVFEAVSVFFADAVNAILWLFFTAEIIISFLSLDD